MKYDLIIFDLDNTLLDFDKMEIGSLTQTLKANELEVSDEIICTYKKINKNLWEQLEEGNYTKSEILELRFKKLFEIYNYEICPTSFNRDYLNGMMDHIHLMDCAKEVLDYYKDKAELAIITNGVESVQKKKMIKSGFDEYFDTVIISDEVGYHKPNVKIFHYLENILGNIDKKKTIIIGDSLTSDIKGGNNYGIDTCWFNPKSLKNTLGVATDYEIKSLEELYKIL